MAKSKTIVTLVAPCRLVVGPNGPLNGYLLWLPSLADLVSSHVMLSGDLYNRYRPSTVTENYNRLSWELSLSAQIDGGSRIANFCQLSIFDRYVEEAERVYVRAIHSCTCESSFRARAFVIVVRRIPSPSAMYMHGNVDEYVLSVCIPVVFIPSFIVWAEDLQVGDFRVYIKIQPTNPQDIVLDLASATNPSVCLWWTYECYMVTNRQAILRLQYRIIYATWSCDDLEIQRWFGKPSLA